MPQVLQLPLMSDTFSVVYPFGNSPEYYAKFGQLGHNGEDRPCPIGTPVYASADGIVIFAGWGSGHSWMGAVAGNAILLAHSFCYTGYAHLDRFAVQFGQVVKKGQLIGWSGNTSGSADGSTGPHLHWEVLPLYPNFSNGYAGRINPRTFTIEPIPVLRATVAIIPEVSTMKPYTVFVRQKLSTGKYRGVYFKVSQFDVEKIDKAKATALKPTHGRAFKVTEYVLREAQRDARDARKFVGYGDRVLSYDKNSV